MTTRAPSLLRQIGIFSASALVVSNMVGTGIFGTTGFLAGQLGSAQAILLIWVVGAICALAGAFCYSELGINFPSSGGEYVYLTEAFGPTWGFMTGWASFFAGFSAPIAAAALACADYAGYFIPFVREQNSITLFGSGEWEFRAGGAQLFASALVIIFTALNCFGLRRTARVQNALTGLKILVICTFIAWGFASGQGSMDHFSEPAVRTSTLPLYAQFMVSMFFIYVSYSGWNAATYVAEELQHPARTLPMSLTYGTIFVAALFCGLNLLFIYAVPLEEMKGVVAIGALAAAHLFGPAVAGLFSAAMAISLLATVNAMVTIGPRIYYAMAKNGAFFASAARVSGRWHTPVAAIVAQGACTVILTMTPFQNLLLYIGITLNFFAVMSVVSLMIFRRRAGWRKLPVVSFAYPAIPLLFVVTGVWMMIFGMTLQPIISSAAILTIVTGAVIYHWRLRGARTALTHTS